MRATATLVITDTVDIKKTATLVPEVPCCSHCQEQFPLDQWIAASRCPITEVHGAGQCHAMFLHRYCVQLHYAKCHPQQECPDEYRHLEQRQTQREEEADEPQEVTADVGAPETTFPDIAQCSHCQVCYQRGQGIQVTLCPMEQTNGPSCCKAGLMHRYCVHPHYEECHSERECPAELRLPGTAPAWLPYADPALLPKAEACSLHRNRCSNRTCPWRHPNDRARCGDIDAEDPRVFPLAADLHTVAEEETEHNDFLKTH